MKHAYLIMAHNQEDLLKILIQMLDVDNNDIYIHLDKKCTIQIDDLVDIPKKANIYFVNRINVTWGGQSQIAAIIELLESALQKHHIYYHMLSGADLPLRSIEVINDFYNKNAGKEFISFFSREKSKKEYNKRFGYKSIYKDRFGRDNNIWKYMNKIYYCIQMILNIRDDSLEDEFFIGPSSWDITENLATEILINKDIILKRYKSTSCCDEAFLQSFIYKTKYWDNLWIPYTDRGTGMIGNMRYIDFSEENNGSPKTIKAADIERLVKSDLNFARKFDLTDYDAIEILKQML